MKEGKFYRFNEQFRDAFIEENGNNENMLTLLKTSGGSFEVLEVYSDNTGTYVNRARMANGEVYGADGMGLEYFELSDEEFKYFIEMGLPSEGVQTISLIVTPYNAEAMIEVIKKAFNK